MKKINFFVLLLFFNFNKLNGILIINDTKEDFILEIPTLYKCNMKPECRINIDHPFDLELFGSDGSVKNVKLHFDKIILTSNKIKKTIEFRTIEKHFLEEQSNIFLSSIDTL